MKQIIKKIYFVVFFALGVTSSLFSQVSSVGMEIGAGYCSHKTSALEGSLQLQFELKKLILEMRTGMCYHSFLTDYKQIDKLEVNSIGFYIDALVFPYKKYLFWGGRWEMANFNWFTPSTMHKLDQINVSYPYVFMGANLFAIAGFELPFHDKLSFRISCMPGVQYYSASMSDRTNLTNDGSIFIEGSIRFILQINASISFKFYRKSANLPNKNGSSSIGM